MGKRVAYGTIFFSICPVRDALYWIQHEKYRTDIILFWCFFIPQLRLISVPNRITQGQMHTKQISTLRTGQVHNENSCQSGKHVLWTNMVRAIEKCLVFLENDDIPVKKFIHLFSKCIHSKFEPWNK